MASSVLDRLEEGLRQPAGRRHPERVAVEAGVLGRDPALLAGDPDLDRATLGVELLEHRRSRVVLGDALLGLGDGQVAEPAQDQLELVAVDRAGPLGPLLQ